MCMYLQIQVRKKAESIRNFSFAEESLYAPPVILQGSVFLDEICNKYKSQGVKGWMNIFFVFGFKWLYN